MTRVAVNPQLLRWARTRARADELDLAIRFPKLGEWERQERQPTLKQLESYARATLTPIGYFFLPEPPVERLPIPDFRTMADRELQRPSPNLLETVYLCQQRQTWYREHAQAEGLAAADFIGCATLQSGVEAVADGIRQRLGFSVEARRAYGSWEEALRKFIGQVDAVGVMVMCSGVVLNNNHRRLDPEEFRGFAIADELAPLVFVNGADSKSAQMFTLAHEVAHLWLGQSALSNAEASREDGPAVERWCNKVAAELLVPMRMLRGDLVPGERLDVSVPRLARLYKVSTLVVLRRLFDAGSVPQQTYWEAYRAEVARLLALPRPAGGGNFYLSQAARVSKRFARALVVSTLEGRTLYRDAMQMLGISKVETFNELGRSLSLPV